MGREIEELRHGYADLPDVLAYLGAVERDLVENIDDFRRGSESAPVSLPLPLQVSETQATELPPLRGQPAARPQRAATACRWCTRTCPTHPNLLGRVEHIAQLGALITDFTLIKAGALHRANGGYLLLDVLQAADAALRLGGRSSGR